jgi:hypothetical protein
VRWARAAAGLRAPASVLLALALLSAGVVALAVWA